MFTLDPTSPDLSDPIYNMARGELLRLFIAQKADLEIGERADGEIVEHVDDLARHRWRRVALARLAGDAAFAGR